MCEFCKKVKEIDNSQLLYKKQGEFKVSRDRLTEIEIEIIDKELFALIAYGEDFVSFEINYCPICGKKLSELLGENKWKLRMNYYKLLQNKKNILKP